VSAAEPGKPGRRGGSGTPGSKGHGGPKVVGFEERGDPGSEGSGDREVGGSEGRGYLGSEGRGDPEVGGSEGRGATGSLPAGVRPWRCWPGFLAKAAPGPARLHSRTLGGALAPAVSEPQDGGGNGQGLSRGASRPGRGRCSEPTVEGGSPSRSSSPSARPDGWEARETRKPTEHLSFCPLLYKDKRQG
jgi:hypothetical protein